jgi:hypothetical protein
MSTAELEAIQQDFPQPQLAEVEALLGVVARHQAQKMAALAEVVMDMLLPLAERQLRAKEVLVVQV